MKRLPLLPQLITFFRLWLKELSYPARKPTVINFNANDICNSGCVMCNIWKQKKDYEISPQELEQILSDPLYDKVTHIGVTGGEPTMRLDLAALYKAIIKVKPGIRGLSIITNAINFKQVRDRILEVSRVCEENKVPFSVMVSLDGVGEVHDRIRGKAGNFESAIKLIDFFKEKASIPVSIGCTVSKGNVWEVDDLLYFIRKKGIYGRFRVAEFIKRLYNEDNISVIRNFNEDELYQLQLFFKKLEHSYERDLRVKRTYWSIRNMLGGGKRLTGCPYQSNGVVLNSRGELAYCAPKSDIIGDAVNSSSLKIYKHNLNHRNRIIKDHCDSCVHDYHADITLKEYKRNLMDKLWSRILNKYGTRKPELISYIPVTKRINKNQYNILIVGWYGTETVGDKAILKGIVDAYMTEYDKCKFYIASLYPFITERTIKELSISTNSKVVNARNYDLIFYSKECDVTVMGGGPLMDLNELYVPLTSFKIAKTHKKVTVVYGCGIGPLKDIKNREVVRSILNLADRIMLRDSGSRDQALQLSSNLNVEVISDPAKSCIEKYNAQKEPTKSNNSVSCYLREWTYEYSNARNHEGFEKQKLMFESGLAKYIKSMALKLGTKNIHFYHMHNFVVGHDDRDFSRYFTEKYFSNDEYHIFIDKKLSTIDSIAESMRASAHNVCMRFHSVLFAHTLGTSFTAIDYTLGGKISFYLQENNATEHILTLDRLSEYEGDTYYNLN